MKFIFITLIFLLLILWPTQVSAATLSNPSYNLDLNTNGTVREPTPIKENVSENVVTNSSAKIIKGDNYIAYLSYEEDNSNLPLLISISSDSLNFGNVKPGESVIRTHSLTVLPGFSNGYEVLSYEDHALLEDNVNIPDTSCDSGSCTQVLADTWSVPLTYGFGYRCDNVKGSSCDTQFGRAYYKRFANQELGETAVKIISSSRNTQSILSYKINISGSQTLKGYQNTIYHILTPQL